MNPAVTLAFAVARKLSWTKVPVYWLAQLLGAIFASACVYGVYLGKDIFPQAGNNYLWHLPVNKNISIVFTYR
jgi:glycerol uptake facilitator protein